MVVVNLRDLLFLLYKKRQTSILRSNLHNTTSGICILVNTRIINFINMIITEIIGRFLVNDNFSIEVCLFLHTKNRRSLRFTTTIISRFINSIGNFLSTLSINSHGFLIVDNSRKKLGINLYLIFYKRALNFFSKMCPFVLSGR